MPQIHHVWAVRLPRTARSQAVVRAGDALAVGSVIPAMLHAPAEAVRTISAPWVAVRRGFSFLYVSLIGMAVGATLGALHLAMAMMASGRVPTVRLAAPAAALWIAAQVGYVIGALLCARIPASTGIRIPAIITAIGAVITLMLAATVGAVAAFGMAAVTNFSCFVTMLGIGQITHAGGLERRALQLLQLNVALIVAAGGMFGISMLLRQPTPSLDLEGEFVFCMLLFLAYFFMAQSQGALAARFMVNARLVTAAEI